MKANKVKLVNRQARELSDNINKMLDEFKKQHNATFIFVDVFEEKVSVGLGIDLRDLET